MSSHPGTPDEDEIAALLALDALDADEQADAELRLGTSPVEVELSAALAELVAAVAPADLKAVVLDHARTVRQPGRPIGAVSAAAPIDGFRRTLDEIYELLRSLSDDEWDLPAHEAHGSVRGLVAHLIGVERLSLRWLDPSDDVPAMPDHVAATRPVVDELAGVHPARHLADTWYAAAYLVASAAATGDRSRTIDFHGLRSDVDGFLTMRTFEHWAHSMDISVATGHPLLALDDERMLTLSRRFMTVVPLALASRRVPVPAATVRFVLTGAAGGTYDVPLQFGAAVSEPAAVVVSDALNLCRVATSRLAVADLEAVVDGDRELAGTVLASLNALALD